MRTRLKALLQLALGLGIAGGLLYLTFRNSTWNEVSRLREVQPLWLAMAAAALLLVHLLRALRWRMMLASAGSPAGLYHITLATLVTYLINSLTPKLGEIVRCSVLLKTDEVPVATSLGTVVSERIVDIAILLVGAGVLILVELDRLGGLVSEMADNIGGKLAGAAGNGMAMWAGIAAGGLIAGAVIVRYLARTPATETGLLGKTRAFLANVVRAARSVFQLERPWLFVLYTALLWLCLVMMNYFFLRALPETAELGWYMAVLILFIAGIGWAAPVPGGMGTTHAIIWKLFVAFELSEAAGKNLAILSNGATLAYNVIFGIVAWLLFIRISYRMGPRLTTARQRP